MQEPLSSLAVEYQSGSPILLEKIKVSFLSAYFCFFYLLLSWLLLSNFLIIMFAIPVDTGQSIYCNQANKRRRKLLLPKFYVLLPCMFSECLQFCLAVVCVWF